MKIQKKVFYDVPYYTRLVGHAGAPRLGYFGKGSLKPYLMTRSWVAVAAALSFFCRGPALT